MSATGIGRMDTRTAFALLGVSATAPVDVVRDAYRDLVKVWHPDRFGDDPRLQAAGTSFGKPLRVVLHPHGEPPTTPAPGP